MKDGPIFALASAPGRAGVAVVRASGRDLGPLLQSLTRKPAPAPRMAALRALYDPRDGAMIDRALILYFPAPHSFTGEDVAEFHIHGGRAVLEALSQALVALDLRPAEAGEFSRRAFHHGKMDLTEAEAIADLVDAQTAAQRAQALRQIEGALGALYEDWRVRLIRLQAFLEAYIDFPDEDLPDGLFADAARAVADLRADMAAHAADDHRGERLREGLALVILGPPNAGKSSLMNHLARRDVAIVSDTPGTTRDVLELALDLGGYPVTLYDTAGLRETQDAIESEGIRRARARAAQADLKILLTDARDGPPPPDWLDDQTLWVANKIDAATEPPPLQTQQAAWSISVKTGAGMDEFLRGLTAIIAEKMDVREAPAITRARHRAALMECLAALERFAAQWPQARAQGLVELLAEDIRLAARALGRITGRVDVEDMLDVLFSAFCIGK